MIFDNPIFKTWYTDTVDIYRVVPVKKGNLDTQERQKVNPVPVPCRVYSPAKNGPSMKSTAARTQSSGRG